MEHLFPLRRRHKTFFGTLSGSESEAHEMPGNGTNQLEEKKRDIYSSSE